MSTEKGVSLTGVGPDDEVQEADTTPDVKNTSIENHHVEVVDEDELGNLRYDNEEEEPELHLRTYLALISVWVLGIVQNMAVQGPPPVLSYIGRSLDAQASEAWISNAVILVQAVLLPPLCSASDMFQARKSIIVGTAAIAFVGCGIAPGSKTINRLIAAQALIGVGVSSMALYYVIPSEVLPRKWRPAAQSLLSVGAVVGTTVGPVVIGAFTRSNPLSGWRNFWWFEMGLWGVAAIGILVAYRPPTRHTRYDHLSFWQKIRKIDITGSFLLSAGLALFLTGLNLGGGLYAWTNARTLATLIIGLVCLATFALYEWKSTKSGIFDHALFTERTTTGHTFAICLACMFIEGIMLFAIVIGYPIETSTVFTTDPLINVARFLPFALCSCVSTLIFGFISTKFRTIREPMIAGFLIWTGGLVGLATVQPSDGVSAIVFCGLSGIGFGGPLIMIIAGVQLAVPHRLIGTATALTTSLRAVSGTIFTAIYITALNNGLKKNLPKQVAPAALEAGLPASSLAAFIGAIAAGDVAGLSSVPGVTPAIIGAGITAFKQAFTDSIRVVFIIGAPFGILGCILAFFLGSVKKTMTYAVDAPIEELHEKSHKPHAKSNEPGA